MKHRRFIFPCVATFLLWMGSAVHAADVIPDWVREAASRAVPEYPARVTSVVLLQEEAVTVAVDGSRSMHERGAIRILQPSTEKIEAVRYYNAKTGRIRDFQGWLAPPSGKPTAYPKNRILDVGVSREEVYDEMRAKVLECGTAAPGSVFAWDVTEEEKTLFTQDTFSFQGREPALVSRFVLTLPPGWDVRSTVFNHSNVEPVVNGNVYTWELRDLPWIEREEHSPTFSALAPRLSVSFLPPSGNSAGLQRLSDWSEVSSWLATLTDPSAAVTDSIKDKAVQLTSGAQSELDKIRAIAAFTQKTNYVEIAFNLTRGGGYTPHHAADTLAKNYGDCKDKATLMRALLKAAGVDTYLVTITAGDRTFVRPEWPSPTQFNHAIVAVRVTGDVKLPTVIENAALGRLLIFDPTDPVTPVGDLPESEQGSYALVIAGPSGALLKMPFLPASANRIESKVDGSLNADGDLTAGIKRRYFGQSGVAIREIELRQGSAEVTKRFERGFSSRIPGTSLTRVATEPAAQEPDPLAVSVDLSARRFGQIMQGRLLVIRPGLLSVGSLYDFSSKKRTAPIKLEPGLYQDSITVKAPPGFKLDELSPAVKLESPYGTLEASWAYEDDNVVMHETLEIHAIVAPASEYAQVRDFFEQVAGAYGAPVVLVKK